MNARATHPTTAVPRLSVRSASTVTFHVVPYTTDTTLVLAHWEPSTTTNPPQWNGCAEAGADSSAR